MTKRDRNYRIDPGWALEGMVPAAFKCLGGDIQGKLIPSKDEDLERCKDIKIVTASYK
ncbi:MAG: fructose-bisphosphatase class II [Halobacillus sp.]|uniref:fructose-bisphosphatase class II n=1 Tax=Halobacillus sp. TaxID=56800 RepID=UPI003BB0D992